MTTFTKEQLISHARESVSYLENLKGRVSKEGADCKVVIEMVARDLKLARIALASLEADPVKRVNSDQMRRVCLEANRHLDKYDAMAKEVNKLLGRIAPPAPVVPEEATPENVEMLSGYVSTYKLTDSERDIAAEIWNACRTAMLQSGNFRESKNSSTNNFREIPEASTSSPVTPALLPGGFTIEEAKELHEDLVRSHISKALSGEKMKKKDRDADLRWIHGVIVQAAWFVKASLEQNALSGNSPATPDGWISCSERMPNTKTAVLVAVEFDRKGDWRMKWATYIPGHPDANDGWIIPGASWKPSHWMPLPEPPQEVNQ
ncbi:DUF551 domain-containing protein [Escherichia coli]|nr:DUF551 domain-containing protein [Escherichia coli]